MTTLLKRLWSEEEGQTVVEYALIIALVSIAAIGALQYLGNKSASRMSSIGNSLD